MLTPEALRDAGLSRIANKVDEVDRGHQTPCWVGSLTRDRDGYSVLTLGGRPQRAHRVVFIALAGPVPNGLQLDHLCRVRECVNPAHMEPVTSAENTLRGEGPTARNARKTHCVHGHEYTPANTVRIKNGRRCRECKRAEDRSRKQRLAMAVTA